MLGRWGVWSRLSSFFLKNLNQESLYNLNKNFIKVRIYLVEKTKYFNKISSLKIRR